MIFSLTHSTIISHSACFGDAAVAADELNLTTHSGRSEDGVMRQKYSHTLSTMVVKLLLQLLLVMIIIIMCTLTAGNQLQRRWHALLSP